MKQSEIKQMLNDISHVADVAVKYSAVVKAKYRKKITSQLDIYPIFHSWYENTGLYEQKEIFCVALVNRANQVLGILKVGEGSATACVADVQYIARAAILAGASAVILCHNHPSGNLNPSDSDKKLTNKIIEALRVLEIGVLDHLIVTPDNGYTSFQSINLI
jgi:DNA repair protein RadC